MKDSYVFLNANDKAWDEIIDEIVEVEKEYGAPFYLFQETLVERNIKQLCECLGGTVPIAYSMKANPWLASAAAKTADYIEVCTAGELELCRIYGIPGKKIVLDGVNRENETFKKALEMGVRRFCIDSVAQAKQLAGWRYKETELEVLLRLSCGNRFGMNENEMKQCIDILRGDTAARIIGVQYYAGTQRSENRKIRQDLKLLEQWMVYLESLCDFQMLEVQFGSGIGFPYFIGDDKKRYTEAVDEVAEFVKKLQRRYKVVYEAGRCIAASTGIYVTKVFQIKERKERKVVFCLGGKNHLQYPGGALGIRIPVIGTVCNTSSGKSEKCMICGALCNEADVLLHSGMLDTGIQEGDLVIFYGTGAYSATESPNLFLTMEMPAVLVYNKMHSACFQDIHCVRGHTSTYRLLDDRM